MVHADGADETDVAGEADATDDAAAMVEIYTVGDRNRMGTDVRALVSVLCTGNKR